MGWYFLFCAILPLLSLWTWLPYTLVPLIYLDSFRRCLLELFLFLAVCVSFTSLTLILGIILLFPVVGVVSSGHRRDSRGRLCPKQGSEDAYHQCVYFSRISAPSILAPQNGDTTSALSDNLKAREALERLWETGFWRFKTTRVILMHTSGWEPLLY